jgi:hypothetical protein
MHYTPQVKTVQDLLAGINVRYHGANYVSRGKMQKTGDRSLKPVSLLLDKKYKGWDVT